MTADFRPEQGALFDLSARVTLRVSGADRLRYLNGQISNDLRKATPDAAIHACVLNAKGKINADVFIVADGESYLVDVEAEMREELADRLERYLIADEVHIEDVTEQFARFHVTGPNVPPVVGANTARADRLGVAGADIRVDREQHAVVFQELSAQLTFCDAECAEVFRIERGVPRWGRELTEEIIPTEANLEAVAIDYAKGCYIGQEVISRIKMSGQTNKRLCGFVPDGGGLIAAGMRLLSTGEAKDVGWITSAAMSQRVGGQIALGFAKRGFQEVGRTLLADGVVQVTVTALPFAGSSCS